MHVASLHGLAAAAVAALTLAACYQPRYTECAVRCAGASDCAPNQICGAEGWCVSAEATGRCLAPATDADPGHDTGAHPADARVPPKDSGLPKDAASIDAGGMTDAAVPVDAGMPDAPPSGCGADCPGTCMSGVCVITCAGYESCAGDVFCPPTTPCHVLCTGERSCRERVFCGSGRCMVTCSGEDSCRRGVRCENACACDVTCSGDDSCQMKAKCPDDVCEVGRGCSSGPSGCSDC